MMPNMRVGTKPVISKEPKFGWHTKDITDRLTLMATEVHDRDKLHGMSIAETLHAARVEILRLRGELAAELFKNQIAQMQETR